jgi:hypothetical protein
VRHSHDRFAVVESATAHDTLLAVMSRVAGEVITYVARRIAAAAVASLRIDLHSAGRAPPYHRFGSWIGLARGEISADARRE